MTTTQTSRELARLSNTPLAKIYVEIQSPFWTEFVKFYLQNDKPRNADEWFVAELESSQKISQEKQTDDEDLILAELLKSDKASKIKEHLKTAPDGWIYENFYNE